MEYFIGIAVSLLVEYLKKKYGTDAAGTYITIAAFSLIAAGVYVVFADAPIFSTLLAILTTAGSFHNFILRRM